MGEATVGRAVRPGRAAGRAFRLRRLRAGSRWRLAVVACVVTLGVPAGLVGAAAGQARNSRHGRDPVSVRAAPRAPAVPAGAPDAPNKPPDGAPRIDQQPATERVGDNDPAIFDAAALGTPTPQVRWQASGDGGRTWRLVGAGVATTHPSGGTATTLSLVAIPGVSGEWFRAVFFNGVGVAATRPAELVVSAAAGQSTNWSGYVQPGTGFSAVAASWTVPTLDCSTTSDASSSSWVGIDGDSSPTVEQDGIEADCVGGVPDYSAWYELYGDPALNGGSSIPLPSATYPVSAGDAITARVSLAAGVWTFAITDATKGWTFTTTAPSPSPAPAQSSAEWIVERPELCSSTSSSSCTLPPLANFGTTAFSAASSTSGAGTAPISAAASSPVVMTGNAGALTQVSTLSASGSSFTVRWTAAG